MRGFQRGVRFSEDVRLIFQIFTVTVPTPANLLPQPQAVLLNHRLTNRPFHYLSLSLTRRESSSNAQVSVSSLTCSRLFIFSFLTRGSEPHATCLLSFLFCFFFPQSKKINKKITSPAPSYLYALHIHAELHCLRERIVVTSCEL